MQRNQRAQAPRIFKNGKGRIPRQPETGKMHNEENKAAESFVKLFFEKCLTIRKSCGIIIKSSGRDPMRHLGVAQLVARYLGVVEAASSSLVTQTKIGGSTEPPIFFCFLANPREISHFRNKYNGLVLP